MPSPASTTAVRTNLSQVRYQFDPSTVILRGYPALSSGSWNVRMMYHCRGVKDVSWLSVEAEAVGGVQILRTLRRNDLTPELDAVVRQGWRIIDGALLLSRWYDSYHGDRSTFRQRPWST